MSIASLVTADALESSGLLVASLAVAISTVVLFAFRGLGPVAIACATLVAVAAQAAGIDFIVAGRRHWRPP